MRKVGRRVLGYSAAPSHSASIPGDDAVTVAVLRVRAAEGVQVRHHRAPHPKGKQHARPDGSSPFVLAHHASSALISVNLNPVLVLPKSLGTYALDALVQAAPPTTQKGTA
jgi:hypothetical protein